MKTFIQIVGQFVMILGLAVAFAAAVQATPHPDPEPACVPSAVD